MPKQMTATLTVPSGSRPSGMLTWLNKILEPHRMSVTTVTDDAALDEATPANENAKLDPGYEAAWREMHGKLNWMQGHPELNKYLGFNFADIANALIDQAYPGLRERAIKAKEENR